MHKLWRPSTPGSYHLEYGNSTMGYEIAGGMGVDRALEAAIIEPLTDEPEVQVALRDLIAAVYG